MSVRWRLVYGGAEVEPFTGREQVDRMVDGLRNAWAAGDLTTGTVTVQVDHGRGWETHEFIDFAHENDDAA